MLLNVVKGCTSFQSIRIVNEVTHPTFQAACYSHRLLGDDREWVDCIKEASVWTNGDQLRKLSATLLASYEITNPTKMWLLTKEYLIEDIL